MLNGSSKFFFLNQVLFVIFKFNDKVHVTKCRGGIVEDANKVELESALMPVVHLHLECEKLGLVNALKNNRK